MVKEYTKKYSLYTAAYYEHQSELFSRYQEKKKQIEEYLLEIKDVIIDDVQDAMRDRRESINACMTVNAPKTPGMTMRRTKRKIQEKRIEIDVDSPNTSIVSEVQGNSNSKARFTGCTSRMDSTMSTTLNTMTPNRTQSALKQTRLQTLLDHNSVNLTPTGSGRATRLTRAKAKLLEQSLINSTMSSMQSAVNTPTLKTKLLDKYNEENSATPVNTTLQNRTRSTVALDNTPNSATPQLNKTAVARENNATPSCAEEGSTPTPVEFPAANSTMVQPGTPAAPFGGNITLITNTPVQSTPVGGKIASLIVSSPIGPIVTNGTSTSNPAVENDKNSSDWVVSTGKRKSSKVESKLSVSTKGTPGPASTPLIKRLQLSTCQPSPVPVATPAEKQPALLSLTIPNTPTPENATVPLFPSPAEEAANTAGTPKLNQDIAGTPKLNQDIAGTPKLNQDITRTPKLNQGIAGTPKLNQGIAGTPKLNQGIAGTPKLNQTSGVAPKLTPDIVGTPNLNQDSTPDVTRTPNLADIRTPGALCRTPALKKVQEVVGTLGERERSGNDLIFAERSDDKDELEISFGGASEEEVGCAAEEEIGAGAAVEENELEDNGKGEVPHENEDMETCETTDATSPPKSSNHVDNNTSMHSEPDQKDVSMVSEEDKNSLEHVQKKNGSESESEAMDVIEEAATANTDRLESVQKIPAVVTKGDLVENTPEIEDISVGDKVSPESNEAPINTDSDTKILPDSNDVQTDEVEEEGNDSNQLFESCDEGEEKENVVGEVEQFSDARDEGTALVEAQKQVEEDEEEEEVEELKVAPKTPLPVRPTRSSRNRKLAESAKKEGAGLDLRKSEDKENEVKEETTQPRTRSTRNRENSKENSSQGSVKEIAASYENISKQSVKGAGISGIPTMKAKKLPKNEVLDVSKREREESETDSMDEKNSVSADESIHLKKKMKDNAGVPRNPPNLGIVTNMGMWSSATTKPPPVKSAKELEIERKEAARKKIEEKAAKAQQVLNKKKQRENEIRLKRIEKEKRMRQAKQNKEDEAKRKKADLEEKMRKKEEASAKEREMLAKKEEEKRQKEIKRQEQAEKRRKQAEKDRELKKKKLQEEAEERKAEALKRKQELEAQKVRELEKHRLDEEARMDEQKKLEAEEHEKRLKAEEERRKLEEEVEKKKTTPSRMPGGKKLNLTGAGTLLSVGATPPPRPPPRSKHANSKIPTKLAGEKLVEEASRVDIEEASNVCSDRESELKKVQEKRVEHSVDRPIPLTKTTSGLLTPIAQSQEAVDSPSSAASNRIQSYMKNKLLSLGKSKTQRNLGNRLDAISEDNSRKVTTPTYDPRDNYKIDDIESGDDTDDESKPKRTVPTWARNKLTLNESLRKQFSGNEKHSAKTIFGPYPKTADLDQLFGTVNRYTSRTSSAHWSAPPTTGNLDFSILTEDEINHANNILLKYK